MKGDRFLTGILIVIGVLVLATLALFFARQNGQNYQPEDTPEGVVHNFALALANKDYEKAYSYLAQENGKPEYATFLETFATSRDRFANVGLQIVSSSLSGDGAIVDVVVVHVGQGPFDDGWREETAAIMVGSDGGWKIRQMPFPYWDFGWYSDWSRKPTLPVVPSPGG